MSKPIWVWLCGMGAALVLWLGCSDGEEFDGVCELEAIALDRVPVGEGDDCGRFPDARTNEATRLELVDARECILSAIGQQRPFRHIRGFSNFEGYFLQGWIGEVTETGYKTRELSGVATITERTCESLDCLGSEDCVERVADLVVNLCLECITDEEPRVLCSAL